MAKKKISQLVAVSSLDGNEPIPLVQGGVTKKATINQIVSFIGGAFINGSGTAGKIPKFVDGDTIGDSIVSESGGSLTINGTTSTVTSFISSSTSSFIGFRDSSGNLTYIGSDDGTLLIQTPSGGYSTKLSLSNTELITFGATDTGEAHIFGGSGRFNGNLGINADTTLFENDANDLVLGNGTTSHGITIYSDPTVAGNIFFADGTTGGDRVRGAVQYNHGNDTMNFGAGGATRMSLSATELITFGATDTGEAHIFGGSARVNGGLTATGNVGVGITTPLSGGGLARWITAEGSTYGGGLISSVGGVAKGLYYYDNSTLTAVIQGTAGVGVSLLADGDYAVRVSGTTRNVLIGTPIPTDDGVNKLQVSGGVKIGGNITMTPSTSLIYGGDTVGLVAMTNSDLASYIRIFGSSYAGTPNDIEFITNSVKRLTIASTGAATFSSSVTAGGTMSVVSTGVDGTFQDAFIARYSGNNAETNAILTAVSSTASGSGFRFDVSNGGGSSARTTALTLTRAGATFSSSVTAGGNLIVSGTYTGLSAANRGYLSLNGTTDNIIVFSNNVSAKGYLFHDGTNLEILNATATGKLKFYTNSALAIEVLSSLDVIFSETIKTGTPDSGTAVPWKLGSVISSGGQSLDTARYVEVEIDGTFYKLALLN